MHELAQSKTALTLAVFLMLGIFLYNGFLADGFSPVVAPASSVGADILRTSQEISGATLSRGVFTEAGYVRLTDFSAPLEPQNLGRTNPFAPLGQ